ncbi:hypothetical protein B2A_15917, partial [mine drainage metagenome]
MGTAYTEAGSGSYEGTPTATELGAGNLQGLTLTPGYYTWSTNVYLPTSGVLYLDGGANAVWVLSVAQVLTINNGARIVLEGGAQAKNIYWETGGGTVIGTGANVSGIILSGPAITMNTGSSLTGSEYSTAAGITYAGNDSVTTPYAVSNVVALGIPTIAVSNTQLNIGQNITLTANVTGGTTPYTYLFTIANSVNSTKLVTNSITTASGSATFTFTANQIGTWFGNVLVTDSEAPAVSLNSTKSTTFTVNSANTVTPSPPASGGGSSSGVLPNIGGTIIKLNVVSNVSQYHRFNVSLGLGASYNVTENYITPTVAGVKANGFSYALALGAPVEIGSNTTARVYMELTNITYTNIQHTIALKFYSTIKKSAIAVPVVTNTTTVVP